MENFRLKVFRSVSRHLSFSRAAEELMLTQPAITQQIKALEEEYGAPLLDRTAGRIQLTPAGEVLLPYALKLKALADEAAAAVMATTGSLGGQLRVGASQTIGQYVLPNLLARFLRAHPHVELRARSGNTDAVLELLFTREIDLALVEGPTGRKDIHLEPFMRDELVLVVPAGHEWAGGEVTLDQLRSAPILMREFGSGSRRIVEHALAKAGLPSKELCIPMELDSTEGLLSAVQAGLGVAFASRWTVRNQLTLGSLSLVRLRIQFHRMFSLAYPAGPQPGGVAGAFRSFLLEQEGELGD